MSHAGRVAAGAGSSEPRAGWCCRGGRRDRASGRHGGAGLAGRHGGAAACTAGRAGRRAPGTAGQGGAVQGGAGHGGAGRRGRQRQRGAAAGEGRGGQRRAAAGERQAAARGERSSEQRQWREEMRGTGWGKNRQRRYFTKFTFESFGSACRKLTGRGPVRSRKKPYARSAV
jgi:hypothetical protein